MALGFQADDERSVGGAAETRMTASANAAQMALAASGTLLTDTSHLVAEVVETVENEASAHFWGATQQRIGLPVVDLSGGPTAPASCARQRAERCPEAAVVATRTARGPPICG